MHMTESEMKAASKRLFEIGKELFSKQSIKDTYYVNEENMQIDSDFAAEPFKVHLKYSVYPENGIVTLFSVLPFDVPQTCASEFAKLICSINYNDFYAGNYDYNPERGKVVFRLALLFRNSILSKELIAESVQYAVTTVSKYNDRLFEAARDK